jgi:UDP-GlcNAc:undecaprenyl-phosphate GlcNAc-1-phosphate transferase
MLWPVVALVAVGFVISLPISAAMIRLGHRLRTMDSPGAAGHRKELRFVPNIGGVAIFAGVALPLLAGVLALQLITAEQWSEWLPALAALLPRVLEGDSETVSSLATATALLACMALLHITGLVDDRKSLPAGLKMLVQVGAAIVMAVWFDVRLLSLLGDVPSIVLTVLWIVAITNAINFMDNMDGLAAGISAIAAALLMAATILNEQWFIAGTLALLIGSLVAFLIFNFPPAKIFMGDGGSLVVGFLLGVLTARTTFLHPELGGGWYAVFMPVIVLAIPLYDLVSVTLIRLKQGKSPFVGDQQHFSHRLVQRGLSKRGAVVVIWCAAAVTGIGGVSLGRLEAWQAMLVGVQTLLMLLMLALLEHASRHAVRREGQGS